MANLRNSAFCRNILAVSVVNIGFALGYSFTCLNPLVPVLEDLYNNTYQKRYGANMSQASWTVLLSLTMSMVLAGGFVGSITVKYVLKVFSRKQTMIFWSVIVIFGAVIISAISGTTGSYEAFIIGRFVMGYGIGVGLNAVTVVIAEFSTQSDQATCQSMTGLAISIGTVFGPIMGHPKVLGNYDRWPAVVAVIILFPLIYICCSPWIPPSPYMLLRQNKRNEAIKVMRQLRIGSEERILNEIATMEEEQLGFSGDSGVCDDNARKPAKLKFVGIKGILRSPQYRRQLFLVVMLYIGAMTTGIEHVLFFSDQIFISGGIPEDVVTYVTIGVLFIQALAALVGVKLLSVLGGRKLILGSVVVIVISHFITTASLATKHLSPYAGYVSTAGILLFLISFSVGPNIAILSLAGELTIEPTRQTILSFGGVTLWFSSWFVGFLGAYLNEGLGPYAFLLWSGTSIIYFVLTYVFVPETKGKTAAEIQTCLAT